MQIYKVGGAVRDRLLGRPVSDIDWVVVGATPEDMARRGFAAGQLVRLRSRHGEIVLPVAENAAVGVSQISVPMHWGSAFLGGQAADGTPLLGINALTTPRFCPTSKQPELKHVAVRVEAVSLPWQLLGLAWLPDARIMATRERLAGMLARFGFASCVPFGRERSGLLFRAAAREPPPDDWLDEIEALLGLNTPDTLRYAD